MWKMIVGYWQAALTLLLSLGASLLTFFAMQSRANRKEKKMQKARADHLKNVLIVDREIEREHDKRAEDLADEVEKKKTSSELSDPNSRW